MSREQKGVFVPVRMNTPPCGPRHSSRAAGVAAAPSSAQPRRVVAGSSRATKKRRCDGARHAGQVWMSIPKAHFQWQVYAQPQPLIRSR